MNPHPSAENTNLGLGALPFPNSDCMWPAHRNHTCQWPSHNPEDVESYPQLNSSCLVPLEDIGSSKVQTKENSALIKAGHKILMESSFSSC